VPQETRGDDDELERIATTRDFLKKTWGQEPADSYMAKILSQVEEQWTKAMAAKREKQPVWVSIRHLEQEIAKKKQAVESLRQSNEAIAEQQQTLREKAAANEASIGTLEVELAGMEAMRPSVQALSGKPTLNSCLPDIPTELQEDPLLLEKHKAATAASQAAALALEELKQHLDLHAKAKAEEDKAQEETPNEHHEAPEEACMDVDISPEDVDIFIKTWLAEFDTKNPEEQQDIRRRATETITQERSK